MDFEQIIVIARNVVTLGHFRDFPDNAGKLGGYVPIEPTELDATKDDETPIEFRRIEHCHIFLMYPLASKRFTRSKTGVGDKLTFAANSLVVKRELFCKTRNICKSVLSNISIE